MAWAGLIGIGAYSLIAGEVHSRPDLAKSALRPHATIGRCRFNATAGEAQGPAPRSHWTPVQPTTKKPCIIASSLCIRPFAPKAPGLAVVFLGGDSRPEIPATSNELVDPAQTFLTGLSWVTEYGASAGPAHGRRRLWEFPVPCPSGRGPYGLIGPRGRVSLSLPLSKSKMSCDGNSCAAGNLKSTSQYGAF